jgi:COX assembly protein 1
MATSSTSPDTSSTTVPNSTPKQYNLRNPLPLSAPQEQEVKLLYYKRVRAHCAPEIKGMQFALLPMPNLLPLRK